MKRKLILGIASGLAIIAALPLFGESQTKTSASPGVITPTWIEKIKRRETKVPWYKRMARNLGIQTKTKFNWQDTRGKGYWTVRNKTNNMITVNSDIHMAVIIPPGKKEKVYRGEKWNLVVKIDRKTKTPSGRTKKETFKDKINTKENREHFVDVYLVYTSWNPPKREIELAPRK